MIFPRMTRKKVLLKQISIFSGLSSSHLRKIANRMDETITAEGNELVLQGRNGWGFYLIIEGRAKVVKNGKKVKTLKAGDSFGEISLIDGGVRSASVIAETDMILLACSKQNFMQLVDTVPGFSKAMLLALCKYIREGEKPSIVS